jgi:hypothetical protein
MAAFPDVTLSTAFIAQTQYSSDLVDVLQIDDNTANKTLRAFCQLGTDPSFKYWVTVMSGDDYTVDWTNAQVTSAIQAFFVNVPPQVAQAVPAKA